MPVRQYSLVPLSPEDGEPKADYVRVYSVEDYLTRIPHARDAAAVPMHNRKLVEELFKFVNSSPCIYVPPSAGLEVDAWFLWDTAQGGDLEVHALSPEARERWWGRATARGAAGGELQR
jgi:hypothetical protein